VFLYISCRLYVIRCDEQRGRSGKCLLVVGRAVARASTCYVALTTHLLVFKSRLNCPSYSELLVTLYSSCGMLVIGTWGGLSQMHRISYLGLEAG